MPNWCNNDLSITGPKKTINIIKDKLIESKKDDNDATGIGEVRIFETLIGSKIDEANGDWYNHNLQRYGTKWDVAMSDAIVSKNRIDSKTEEITMTFDTAWSPPIEFCTNLSKLYPDLAIRLFYSESGCDFSGEFVIDKELGSYSEEYGYYEGLYLLRKEVWWESIEYCIELAIEDDESFKSFSDNHSYISEDDIDALKEIYKEIKKSFKEN